MTSRSSIGKIDFSALKHLWIGLSGDQSGSFTIESVSNVPLHTILNLSCGHRLDPGSKNY